jgi:cytochrome d ubiquinol oxidase subunit II
MSPEPLVAGVLGLSLVLYVLTAGADFGGGWWDLLARGPRQVAQRRAIALAIGPIWEANHVWLILALVLTFVAFPLAFAAISTALHIPLVILLVGIVLRGTAFVFRSYDSRDDAIQRRWSAVFAVGSTVSPIMLGVVVGAIASGQLRVVDGLVQTDFYSAWLAPFPFVVGLLTLAIFAYLAAVYLCVATWEQPALQEDFRLRGLWAAAAVFSLAWLAFFLARSGAPRVWDGLWANTWSLPLQGVVALVGASTIGALWRRRYHAARWLGALQVAVVVGGWAVSQYPYVVPPDLTVYDAAPPVVLWNMLAVLALGSGPLLATYVWMLRVFRGDGVPLDHRQSADDTITSD